MPGERSVHNGHEIPDFIQNPPPIHELAREKCAARSPPVRSRVMVSGRDAANYGDGERTRHGASSPMFERERLSIPLETIRVLNWLGEIGVDGVESRLDHLPATDLTVRTEQVKIDYAEPATILRQFGAEYRAGARVRLRKPFAGHVLVLFPIESANRAAALMLKNAVTDVQSVVSTEMGRDALTELCNMVANGFVDEWANVFDTPFDTVAPVAVQNPELTVIHRIFGDSEMGLYLTSRIRIVEHEIEAVVFVFPGEKRFIESVSRVDPKDIH